MLDEPTDGGPFITPEQASLPAAGLVTWLRGDRGVYKTSADAVCAWVDQSGSGFVFTAAPAARPTWLPAGIGGQPGITFGTNQPVVNESVLGLPAQGARTIAVVAQHVNTAARFYPFVQGNYSNNYTYLGIEDLAGVTVRGSVTRRAGRGGERERSR